MFRNVQLLIYVESTAPHQASLILGLSQHKYAVILHELFHSSRSWTFIYAHPKKNGVVGINEKVNYAATPLDALLILG